MKEVLTILGPRIHELNAEIDVPDLPQIYGYSRELSQLFQNLLSNALKFHGNKPPRIVVNYVSNPGEWLFSVQDYGIGLRREHIHRIFTIFERLHKNEDYPGTGIGLAICKKIVDHHGGEIWVESEFGEGSTFNFTIPKKETADEIVRQNIPA